MSPEQDSPVRPSDPNGVGPAAALDESGNVDRIRNILFGNQMRDYDVRFQRLEDRLVKDAAALRGEVSKRVDDLEAFMHGEVETLTNRLRAEHSERTGAIERLGRELAETARNLESRLHGIDEQTANHIRELRQRVLEQSKGLGAELKEQQDRFQAALDGEARQIRGAMTGRESLAEMLTEVALRLKGEFHVPGAS